MLKGETCTSFSFAIEIFLSQETHKMGGHGGGDCAMNSEKRTTQQQYYFRKRIRRDEMKFLCQDVEAHLLVFVTVKTVLNKQNCIK